MALFASSRPSSSSLPGAGADTTSPRAMPGTKRLAKTVSNFIVLEFVGAD